MTQENLATRDDDMVTIPRAEYERLTGIVNIPFNDNEGTESPWWAIVMPRQIMSKNAEQIAQCIVGVFFSRESAENHLNSRRYEYGNDAIVYCFSGYWSRQYKQAVRSANTSKKLNDADNALEQ